MNQSNKQRRVPLNIILPALITLTVFVMVFFLVIVPYYEISLMNRKKEMISELTNSAWSILENYNQEVQQGIISEAEAKDLAIDAVGNLRYGEEFKDYFWITDMHPRMIIHPYRSDLNGKDLSDYRDPHGKKLFVECVKVVRESGEGYVDYMWQWKDDSTHIVQKLSFVKGFSPWNWVVGTGIYLEDLYEEIKALKRKLIYISLTILLVIGVILVYIVIQNISLENKKQDALHKLKLSREKYKTLVESSTEGLMMILDKQTSFVNVPLARLTGYSVQELVLIPYSELFIKNDISLLDQFFDQDYDLDKQRVLNFETTIKKKNGNSINVQISASSIIFENKAGCMLSMKDVGSLEQARKELNQQVEQFKLMTDQVNIGVFRTSLGRSGNFLDINTAALNIFGYSHNEIFHLNMFDLFSEKENTKEIIETLFEKGEVIDQLVRLKTKDNSVVTTRLSLFLTKSTEQKERFCDGIIQDVSIQLKQQKETAQLLEDLQLANNFLNQAVKTLERPVLNCHLDDSIEKVVQMMSRTNSEVVLVQSKEGFPLGIFSDSDLKDRVVAEKVSLSEKIHKVMVAPLTTISENQMLFEAILKMRAKQVKYICMINQSDEITGVLSLENLANAQHHSQTMLMHRIHAAKTKEELKVCYDQLSPLVKALMDSGMRVQKMTALMSNISDGITKKVIELCSDNMGTAPVKYAFITLGSVGRKEQTLATDQDNAIIFEDVEKEQLEVVQKYFIKLGKHVNEWLDYIGYNFCIGEVMARNPKWCQPLTVWKKYFDHWIGSSTPQSLIDTSIFYDLRYLEGDSELVESLMNHVTNIKHNRSLFLYHLAQTILALKPPISFFGNFIVESGEEHKSSLDIKQVITIITGFLRVYALKNQLQTVNSMERLSGLVEIGKFSEEDQKGISDAYNYLMNLRIKHQLELIHMGKEPDNYINPKKVSEIERSILKKIFSKLTDLQSKMSFDFKGTQ